MPFAAVYALESKIRDSDSVRYAEAVRVVSFATTLTEPRAIATPAVRGYLLATESDPLLQCFGRLERNDPTRWNYMLLTRLRVASYPFGFLANVKASEVSHFEDFTTAQCCGHLSQHSIDKIL